MGKLYKTCSFDEGVSVETLDKHHLLNAYKKLLKDWDCLFNINSQAFLIEKLSVLEGEIIRRIKDNE